MTVSFTFGNWPADQAPPPAAPPPAAVPDPAAAGRAKAGAAGEGDGGGGAAEFMARFAAVWAAPTPDRVNELVHPEAEFRQPLRRRAAGHAEAAAMWADLLRLIPDLRGELLSWAERDGVVFAEVRLRGTLGGKPIEWVSVDRLTLDGGKVRRRTAHFDPLPLLRALATRPKAWPVLLRRRARASVA